MRTPSNVALALALTLALSSIAGPSRAAPLSPPARPLLTLERAFSDPPLEGAAPKGLKLAPDGSKVVFLKGSAANSEVLDLWAQDLPTGAPRLLVAASDLLGGATQRLTEQERMALERKRISERGITSFLWCGADARTLVFPFSGDLIAVFLTDSGSPRVVRLTDDAEVPELNPVCSSDGRKIAFVKKGDVHVLDVSASGKAAKARPLTRGAGPTRTFGLPEFIAEEEMDRHEGMWWSPDGKALLVFEVDEARVGVKVRAQIYSDRTELVEQRYPAAGEANAVVTPWLIDVPSGKRTRLAVPNENGYLPRAGFFGDGRPWLQWQSRDQRRLVLFEGDARGKLRPILEDKDDAWVELHDDFEPLKDPQRFLWSSEQSGVRQLYVGDRATGALVALTAEPEPVERIMSVDDDKGLVFFTAYRDRGRQLQLFSVPLAGGAPTPITTEAGWHQVTFDKASRYFVDKRSSLGRPWRTSIRAASGAEVLMVDANPAAELATFASGAPRWLDLLAADGKTALNGVVFPPVSMAQGARLPVITFIYGGPGTSTVKDAWSRHHPTILSWNALGYGVFLMDNRGMAGRDRAFGRAHHNAFGVVEVSDLFASVRQLVAQVPWVDPARIGVFGWSYGGTLAARAVLDPQSPFAAAASVAPVTDWSLYDTHYTERYIGMPRAGDAVASTYAQGNLVERARLLERPLLLMHGTADDNVLFEHSLRLAEALQKEGKLFELMIYPGKAHGISGKQTQLHVFRTITTFFDGALGRPK